MEFAMLLLFSTTPFVRLKNKRSSRFYVQPHNKKDKHLAVTDIYFQNCLNHLKPHIW